MLKPQSIRKNVKLYLNKELIHKSVVIEMSKDWSENKISLFKRLVKQGGTITVGEDKIKIVIDEQVLNSRGEIDGGIIKMPGVDDRF